MWRERERERNETVSDGELGRRATAVAGLKPGGLYFHARLARQTAKFAVQTAKHLPVNNVCTLGIIICTLKNADQDGKQCVKGV